SDTELVLRFRSGDTRAFDRLVQRWQEPIYRLAWRYTGSADEAMDVTQNTFMKAWTRIDSLDQPDRFSAWLYRICRHQCLDHQKISHKQRFVGISGLRCIQNENDSFENIGDEDGFSPQQDLEIKQTAQILTEALERIPEEQKMIIT